jgi:hypothetical protein
MKSSSSQWPVASDQNNSRESFECRVTFTTWPTISALNASAIQICKRSQAGVDRGMASHANGRRISRFCHVVPSREERRIARYAQEPPGMILTRG